jgi:hypothetical protein
MNNYNCSCMRSYHKLGRCSWNRRDKFHRCSLWQDKWSRCKQGRSWSTSLPEQYRRMHMRHHMNLLCRYWRRQSHQQILWNQSALENKKLYVLISTTSKYTYNIGEIYCTLSTEPSINIGINPYIHGSFGEPIVCLTGVGKFAHRICG